jgi:hypothetical protein
MVGPLSACLPRIALMACAPQNSACCGSPYMPAVNIGLSGLGLAGVVAVPPPCWFFGLLMGLGLEFDPCFGLDVAEGGVLRSVVMVSRSQRRWA